MTDFAKAMIGDAGRFVKRPPVKFYERNCLAVYLVMAFCGAILLSGCGGPSITPTPRPPQLLEEITIAPGTSGAILPSATPTQTAVVIPTTEEPTETDTPAPTVITDTSIPSLTPRPTHTDTPTPTDTPITPTETNTPEPTLTLKPRFSPTPSNTPLPPTLPPCPQKWFFEPRPELCPLDTATSGNAVLQQFQNGFMIWFQPQKLIFVVYTSAAKPRWAQYIDNYTDGTPATDPTFVAPSGLIQAQRGFGYIWRTTPRLRQRIGWAVSGETSYSATLQVDINGNRYIRGPGGEVFQLNADYSGWQNVQNGTPTPTPTKKGK